MKYLAVIDTNVLVSAMIKPQSVPRQVVCRSDHTRFKRRH